MPVLRYTFASLCYLVHFYFSSIVKNPIRKATCSKACLEANLEVLVIENSPRCYLFPDDMRVVGFWCWLRTVGGLETYVDYWCYAGVVSVLFFIFFFSFPFLFSACSPFPSFSSSLHRSSMFLHVSSFPLLSFPLCHLFFGPTLAFPILYLFSPFISFFLSLFPFDSCAGILSKSFSW